MSIVLSLSLFLRRFNSLVSLISISSLSSAVFSVRTCWLGFSLISSNILKKSHMSMQTTAPDDRIILAVT